MMKPSLFRSAAAAAFVLSSASAASAQVMTFEGIPNGTFVNDFYNGIGGPDYDVVFVDALAAVDRDAGGSGVFENEPSPSTAIFSLSDSFIMNHVGGGFHTGLLFWYAVSVPTTVNLWSGLDATGTLLASVSLAANHQNGCAGTFPDIYCNWDPRGVAFAGFAQSVEFAGSVERFAFDDITLGRSTPVSTTPEPVSMLLLGTGLAGVAAARRRRRSTLAA